MNNRPTALFTLFFLAFIISFSSCNEKASKDHSSGKTVAEVIDKAVTRIYKEGKMEDYANATQEKVLHTFTEEEKEILASQYLKFHINQEARVLVFRSIKQEEAPFWLEERGFEQTGKTAKNESATYEIWVKVFPEGEVGLGIPGFDKPSKVYFTAIQAMNENEGKPLEVEPIFPEEQEISSLEVGSYTYFDWDELVLKEIPKEFEGSILLVTNRGRSRESHLINAFRYTDFPATDTIDQIIQTWAGDPQTSLALGWRTAPQIEKSQISYWIPGSKDTLTQMADSEILEDRLLANDRYNRRFRVELSGLKPGTEYEYQLSASSHESKVYRFVTDDGDDQLDFGWFGDLHSDPNWGKALQEGDKRFNHIQFYLQSGDLVNTGLYRDDWDKTIAYSGEVFRNKPFMAVSGNHDTQEGLPPTRLLEYLKYPHNGPENKTPGLTYSFVYGNTEFFMLDVVGSSEESQAEWLEEQLKQSKATFKIAAFHFSPYTPHEDYQEIKKYWNSLFEKYGVDLVLTGHFHYYQRTKADGADLNEKGTPTYVMSVGTTNKNEDNTTIRAHEIVYFKPHLFQHISVRGRELTLAAYDQNGKEIDRFSIEKS